jgi:PleD family two-component response regulator
MATITAITSVGHSRHPEKQRAQADSIARWGGEEFLMLLPGTDAKGAAVLAEKLRGRSKAQPLCMKTSAPMSP